MMIHFFYAGIACPAVNCSWRFEYQAFFTILEVNMMRFDGQSVNYKLIVVIYSET
jgi:hypothetical protein